MRFPAWVERAGVARPLETGVRLETGDVLRTGAGARALLRLDEGSVVKLGAEARFAIREVRVADDQWGSFSALFDVLRGAFRFTTASLGAQRRRDVTIAVGAVTAGIRGTDIWGRARGGEDLVALIEGQVEIRHADRVVRLEQPASAYVAPRDGDAGPVSVVEAAQLAAWAGETEPIAGSGLQHADGIWVLHLAAAREAAGLDGLVRALQEAGVAPRLEAAEVDGVAWTRAVLPGFASRADALAVGRALRERFALPEPWVSTAR